MAGAGQTKQRNLDKKAKNGRKIKNKSNYCAHVEDAPSRVEGVPRNDLFMGRRATQCSKDEATEVAEAGREVTEQNINSDNVRQIEVGDLIN